MGQPRPTSLRTVFVSHAHVDNELCDRYVAALRDRGFDIWYDRTNLQGGSSLSGDIERELQARAAFLLLLTPASVDSYWVRLETGAYRDLAARDRSRILLPVRIAPCEIPLLLRELKVIDALEMPFNRSIDAIAQALNSTFPASLVAPTPSTPPRSLFRVSRRVVLVSAGLLAVSAVGTGAAFFLNGGVGGGTPSTPQATQMPTRTPLPQGYTYTFYYQDGTTTSLAWSPDGKRIVSGGRDVRVWDTDSGQSLASYNFTPAFSPPTLASTVAWSPGNSYLAVGTANYLDNGRSGDYKLRVWDARAAAGPLSTLMTTFPAGREVKGVDFGGDERLVYGGFDHTVRVEVLRGGAQGERFFVDPTAVNPQWADSDSIYGVAWEPNGERLAAATGGNVVRLWRWSVNQSNQPIQVYRGHETFVVSVAWSPPTTSGSLCASGDHNGQLHLWSPDTGKTIVPPKKDAHTLEITSICWSPDGQYLATASNDGTVKVWDTNLSLLFTYSEHTQHNGAAVQCVRWSPNGMRVASSAADGVRIWKPL